MVRYAPGKDGVNNLMSIYAVATGKSFAEIEAEFAGQGYGAFKMAVGQAVADTLTPIRETYQALRADQAYLEQTYTAGARRAQAVSSAVMADVYAKLGYVKPGR